MSPGQGKLHGSHEEWLGPIRERFQEVQKLARQKKVPAFFSIGSTQKKQGSSDHPYLTPIRELEHGVLSGAVVFNQTQAIVIAYLADGVVDHVLVDAEKRIDIEVEPDFSVLDQLSIPRPVFKNKSRVPVELGNLSAATVPYIKKSSLIEYKPNDLTVDAVWHLVSYQFGCLSGHRVGIIGCGNIGFKLALRMVEAGCNVGIHRRDEAKGRLMAETINQIKPSTTLALAQNHTNPMHAALFADVLIGASPGVPLITLDMVKAMSPRGFLIDVGKGTISEAVTSYCADHVIPVFRCDITSAIYGFVSSHQRNFSTIRERMGRRELDRGVYVISGGYLGKRGDIVVDNFQKPTQILGVADGAGDFLKERDVASLSNIAQVSKLISDQKG